MSKDKTVELQDLPISSIVDGWVIKDGGQYHGQLYLFVKCPDGVTRTTFVERAGGLGAKR